MEKEFLSDEEKARIERRVFALSRPPNKFLIARRLSHTLRKYRITREQYEWIREKQNGSCAICGRRKRLVIDHCHKNGKVRGLLCSACNSAVGLLRDNPETARKLGEYLNETGRNP
jgi:hypothetical protein